MSQINHKQLDFMLKVGYNSRLPLYIRGGIGIGKSTHVEEFAQGVAGKIGFIYLDWNSLPRNGYDPVQMDEHGKPLLDETGKPKPLLDANGVAYPHVTGKDDVLSNPAPYMCYVDQRALMMDLGDFKLPKFDDHGGFEWCIPTVYKYLCNPLSNAILFLDEFNLAPPSIQGMFYSIVNDREIGENKLAENVYVLLAGNTQKDRAAIYEMPMPLRNRLINVELEIPTIDDWQAWALNGDATAPKIDTRVTSFLRFKRDLLYMPAENGEFAFPTPRSWERVSACIEGITKLDEIRVISESLVGDAVATEFVAFCKMTSKISIEDIIKTPALVKQYAKEPSIMCALAGGLIEKYRGNHKMLPQIVKVYEEMADEFGMWGFKMIKDISGKKWFPEIQAATDVKKFADRYGKYLLDD